jgi:ribosomal 30S subunit maturation factor RimM
MILVGVIIKPVHSNGDLFVENVLKDFLPIPAGTSVKVGYSINYSTEYRIEKWSKTRKSSTVKLQSVDTTSHAHTFAEAGIFVDESILENIEEYRQKNSPYFGIEVLNAENNEKIGEVIEYWELPANDVFYVSTPEGNLPIPNVPHFIAELDEAYKKMRVNVIDGLMDLVEGKKDES